MEYAVVADHLVKTFKEAQALRDLSFNVKKGEVFGLVGPDGAGKSTTLRILATVLRPTSGSSTIMGLNCQKQSDLVKDHVAYMSQKFGLYPDLTVLENVLFYADMYGVPRSERLSKAMDLLHFSYMHPFTDRPAGKLSGGMKQKLQLVCALIHTPQVLLLDEPTNGVDPISRRDFWRILYKLLDQGVSILVTTAYMDEAERCDRIALLDHGAILAQGTIDELRHKPGKGILSVKSTQARKAAMELKGKGNWSITLFGDRLHLLCSNPAEEAVKVKSLLDQVSIPSTDVGPQPLSLEDVFLSLTPEAGIPLPPGRISDERRPVPHFPNNMAVSVRHLTKKFGTFVADNDLNFDVAQGEIFGFLGPNGAGKSTAIRMLCGLLTPTSGSGYVGGWDVVKEPEGIKEHIGYMSQKFSLYDDLYVEENLNFYGGIYGLEGSELEERKNWALKMSGLEERRKFRTSLLSGGWKQKLALSCALLHSPPIVFLDEPTSGVDPVNRRSFWEQIARMANEGITVFVTTHYMEEAEYCNRICLIFRGNMLALGSPSELKASIPEKLFEVRIPNAQKHLEELLALPGVADGALFGSAVHLSTEDPPKAQTAVNQYLTAKGIPLENVRSIMPSMEDVFVSIVAHADTEKTKEPGGKS